MSNTIYQQLLIISEIGMIIVAILLIMISIKWLNNIRFSIDYVAKISQDFSSMLNKAKGEMQLIHQELREVINITSKKENKILQGLFYSEEIKIHMDTLLTELREFKELIRQNKKQETDNKNN